MSSTFDIHEVRNALRDAFCGSERRSLGIRHTIEAAGNHILSYVKAIDAENVGPPDLITNIEEDWRLKEYDAVIEECRSEIQKQTPSSEVSPDSVTGEHHVLASLLMIPEELDAAGFFLRRLTTQTASLMREVADKNGKQERMDHGISEFAQLEIREICQRLTTITAFTTCLIRESPAGSPGHKHITRLTDQLAEFIQLATARHVERWMRGQCKLHHDRPYRVILDAFRHIGRRVAQVALHWSAGDIQEDV